MTVELYDTTLRDGAQMEGISLSVADKLRIARKLDELGVHFIEGGFPAANPKDVEFFERIREVKLRAKLVAFGSTRRAQVEPAKDATLNVLANAGTDYVTIVGKANDVHVRDVLETSLEENLAMIRRLRPLPQVEGQGGLLRRRALLRRLLCQPRLRSRLSAVGGKRRRR